MNKCDACIAGCIAAGSHSPSKTPSHRRTGSVEDLEDLKGKPISTTHDLARLILESNNTKEASITITGLEADCYPFRAPLGMQSLAKLFRVGYGPSSSHSIGPFRAASKLHKDRPDISKWRVTLYGSLAATGMGHKTPQSIVAGLETDASNVEIIWKPDESLPKHTNGMLFEGLSDDRQNVLYKCPAYSPGGGAVIIEGFTRGGALNTEDGDVYVVYPEGSANQIEAVCVDEGLELWEYVYDREDAYSAKQDKSRPLIEQHLMEIWNTMKRSISIGLSKTGYIGDTFKIKRAANTFMMAYKRTKSRTAQVSAYALAVAETNAGSDTPVVTAPTCGSCGIVPSVLYYLQQTNGYSDLEIVHALAVAGIIGNIVKTNASISGAACGCQAEVGTACAMAAAAAASLFTVQNVRIPFIAAEIALEHALGLSCDPVGGFVMVPCIERNPIYALRALDCAEYAMIVPMDSRVVSFDEGRDMSETYKETAKAGLALTYNLDERIKDMKKAEEEKQRDMMKRVVAEIHSQEVPNK